MSRVGNKPIAVPKGVTIKIEDGAVFVEGPKGKLRAQVPPAIRFERKDSTLLALRDRDEDAALHGLARSLVQNAVTGVTTGFSKELDIVGIGYRASVAGRAATFVLGYSHPIDVLIPDGIAIAVEKQTHIVVSGADRGLVGEVAASIRALRPPDPYKNKGIRYTGEVLKKKVGKTGAK
ncbi:MAG TPA: 50S ribosomal protein L6 [Bryobacterales bacterium]|nr:50S ribosomal protein L6 [Bryobacterales bacterium]